MSEIEKLPVAVIGAGPIGLAAAAHLIQRNATPLVLEVGDSVGASVRAWSHVRMFSPWEYNVDRAATGLLEASGWTKPAASEYPTGDDLVRRYLEPLAALPELRPHVRLNARVTAVSRLGLDRLKTPGREDAPFVLHVSSAAGDERVLARAVIDASGTVGSPNPLGADGVAAMGERALAHHVFYGMPDVRGALRPRYAGRRVLVVGSGHSAFTALLDLVALAEEAPGTRVLWAIRREGLGSLFGGGANDALPERGALGLRLRQLLDAGRITLFEGVRLERIARTDTGIVASGADRDLPAVDEIVAATGYRPDLDMLRELRLSIDPIVECPGALASVIDPNVHSCGTVPPHGEDVLRQPEPGFYLAGMKSYGRAPNFLLLTGYEQVRSIVCALTGDAESARRVQLVLPATGVCSSDLPNGDATASSACCGGPAEASVEACCVADAEAKAAGHGGCGCGPESAETATAAPVITRIAPLGGARDAASRRACCS